jgi:Ca2+/Na+ antiporter
MQVSFVLSDDSHFMLSDDSHFMLSDDSHFVLSDDSILVLLYASHFVLSNHSVFVLSDDSPYVLWDWSLLYCYFYFYLTCIVLHERESKNLRRSKGSGFNSYKSRELQKLIEKFITDSHAGEPSTSVWHQAFFFFCFYLKLIVLHEHESNISMQVVLAKTYLRKVYALSQLLLIVLIVW